MKLAQGSRRLLIAASSSLVAAVLLAGCGGGGSSPMTPSVSQNNPAPSTGSGNSSNPPAASPTETIQSITISSADTAAAQASKNLRHHMLPAHIPGQKPLAPQAIIQYPEDLGYSGGKVLTHISEHNIYVSPTTALPNPSTWGNPYKFLFDLGHSTFIHVTDQYTNTSGTYYPNTSLRVSNPNLSFAPLYDNDVLAVVHAAASLIKQPHETGYERIYNVFFPPGVDVCFTFTTECYSPDNLSTFAFCAYHTSVDFPDIGHVLYTVEPYDAVVLNIGGQQIPACSIQDPSSPSFLESAVDSALSHETFESITDPDPPSGWTVLPSNGGVANGAEIGDLCAYTPIESSDLSGTTYAIQPEYSNLVHGCVNDTTASTASLHRRQQ